MFFTKLIPSTCIVCGGIFSFSHSFHFCPACLKDLPILSHHCERCAIFLPYLTNKSGPLICGTCLIKPPPFERTFALFPYEPPITTLITALKFHQQLSHAEALGKHFAQHAKKIWYKNKQLPDLILPIPLHTQRLSERGFNQALEIAKPIARQLSIPIDTKGVLRTKPTVAQSGLSADARRQNIAHAFTAVRHYHGLSVAILDDVITTGHTVTACARLLKINGAKRIHVWCIARRG